MRSFFVYIIKRDDFCNSICYNEWGALNEIRGIIKSNNKHGLYLDLDEFASKNEISGEKYTMNDKYKLLEKDTIKFNGTTLYRIESLKDFGDVSKGDKGGYIEKEENLSTTGNAWVGGDAYVTDNAYVTGNAYVADEAWVYGDAIMSGNARLFNNARVYGNAQVSENAKVSDEAWVTGNAKVSGNVQVTGEAWVTGEALVDGNAHLSRDAQVSSEDGFLVVGPIGSEGRYLTAFKSRNEKIYVIRGGFDGTLEEFEEAVNKLYGDNKCGKVYRLAIELIKAKLGNF